MYDPATNPSPAPETPNPLARADALEREITDLCAQINAASYRLLQLIAELDDEAPWGAWGLNSCAHFLNWRCGIGLNAAREKVRVAHALKQLPQISASFATGELSFSRVRAVTRIADPRNEKQLLDLARHATAAHVEKLVRAYRSVGRRAERKRAAKQQASRELTYYHDEDGSLVIRARLPAEAGAVVLQALNAAMDARRADQSEAESDDVTAVTPEPSNRFAQRRADALSTLAETTLRHGPAPLSAAQRYQVVVHVTAETLARISHRFPTAVVRHSDAAKRTVARRTPDDPLNVVETTPARTSGPCGAPQRLCDALATETGEICGLAAGEAGRCELENGPGLALDTVRRIACDGSLLRITEDDAGNPLDIGRKTRAVPPKDFRKLSGRQASLSMPRPGSFPAIRWTTA